ncbi:hypothetical protein Tco_0360261 [Tanacetum coccineum]
MASLFAKRVASNLLRVRSVASCSRFFTTKGYQYVQHDYEGDCILKCDDKHGSSFIHGVVNDAFSPDFTPIGNLGRLLSAADDRVGFRKTYMLPRWIVLENDTGLCLVRNMTGEYGRSVNDYVPKKQVMSRRPHEEDISFRERDLSLILNLMRGLESEPSDYYFDKMQNAEEVDSFVESMMESLIGIGPPGTIDVMVNVCVHALSHPQAVFIIVGLGAPGIGSPYGGYA